MGRRKRWRLYERSDIYKASMKGLSLHEYSRIKEPELAQEAGREELNVHVVHLNYRDQPRAIDELFKLIRPPYDRVDGESEEMLTVRVAAGGMILSVAPPPGRYFPGLVPESGEQSCQELPVDRLEDP